MIVLKIGVVFDTILQHYSRITRKTEIPLCLWVHRHVCCDKTFMSYVKCHIINRNSRFEQFATVKVYFTDILSKIQSSAIF